MEDGDEVMNLTDKLKQIFNGSNELENFIGVIKLRQSLAKTLEDDHIQFYKDELSIKASNKLIELIEKELKKTEK